MNIEFRSNFLSQHNQQGTSEQPNFADRFVDASSDTQSFHMPTEQNKLPVESKQSGEVAAAPKYQTKKTPEELLEIFEKKQMNLKRLPLGNDTIKEKLGQGGFGSVEVVEREYAGKNSKTKKIRLIFKKSNQGKPGDIKKEFEESESLKNAALSALAKPSNLLVYQQGIGNVALTREFIEETGVGVQECVFGLDGNKAILQKKSALYSAKDNFPVNLHAAIEILAQISNALLAIHDAGYVHADLKFPNIVVDYDASKGVVVKVIDLGTLVKSGQNILAFSEECAPELCDNAFEEENRSIKAFSPCDMWMLGTMMIPILFGGNFSENSIYNGRYDNDPAKAINAFNKAMLSSTGKCYTPEVLQKLIDLRLELLRDDPEKRLTAVNALESFSELAFSNWEENSEEMVATASTGWGHQSYDSIKIGLSLFLLISVVHIVAKKR